MNAFELIEDPTTPDEDFAPLTRLHRVIDSEYLRGLNTLQCALGDLLAPIINDAALQQVRAAGLKVGTDDLLDLHVVIFFNEVGADEANEE